MLLRVTGNLRIDDVFARPQLAPDLRRAEVAVSFRRVERPPARSCADATTLRLGGSVVTTA
ncbi:MAG: hypothetical protein IPK19_35940 [Chloroflexi bacterium]|nr:hypothetical protein [Chloroflexota bacterium]